MTTKPEAGKDALPGMIATGYDAVRKAVLGAYKLGYKDGLLDAAEQASKLQGTARRPSPRRTTRTASEGASATGQPSGMDG